MKKQKLTKERKQELLKNAGKAIDKFRKLKKWTVVELANKSKINLAIINDICTGKVSPTKEEIKLCCKAMDIPKEVILLYSIDEQDVAPIKRELFNSLLPSLKGMVEDLVESEDDKPKKKNKKAKKTAPKKSKAKK